jgi:hypothetical protein
MKTSSLTMRIAASLKLLVSFPLVIISCLEKIAHSDARAAKLLKRMTNFSCLLPNALICLQLQSKSVTSSEYRA